jgi:hypothetical protein
MALLYGRILTATGWAFPHIDELTMTDVEDLNEFWKEQAGSGTTFEATTPQSVEPREITEEEWKRICEREKAWADSNNGPGNPFL